MKFENLCKFILNESDVVEDAQELADETLTDDGKVEDALERLLLGDATDLSEIQKRELAEKAIEMGLYDKVLSGKIQPEDAYDLLLNLPSDDDIETDDDVVDLPSKDEKQASTSTRKSVDLDDFPEIKKGYEDFKSERDFESGQDY